MPFCPECRDEYRPGFTRCVDCGVELVEYLPEVPEAKEASEPPVVVFETSDFVEAEVVRAKLEYYGISAGLSGELAQRGIYNPMSPNLFGPVRVVVPADQAADARDVLEDVVDT